MTLSQLMQVAAILLTGLVAGLFYSFTVSVTGGLGKLPARDYLAAFQSINREILNPWFFASFLGCVLVLPLASWFTYQGGPPSSFYLLLASTIIYLVGVFGVTVFANVPLNEHLAQLNLDALPMDQLQSERQLFERPWTHYNLIRTVASGVCFLLAVLSFIRW